MFKPRPKQEMILAYTGGKMGVSAVPGSGKTHTLSFLAAKLIAEGFINDDQEVLIVTLVNSAVDNFSSRVAGFVKSYGLLPEIGYRVRTLHGLAHDIIRERPDLAGLSDRFSIVDERESNEILENVVQTWLKTNPEFVRDFKAGEIDLETDRWAQSNWSKLVIDIAHSFIRQAKDMRVTTIKIHPLLEAIKIPRPLLWMGYEIYLDYQRALNYRSAVDFDDLIRLALDSLDSDPEYLKHLQYRWPFVLEDEAQDSSRLQEEILRKLSAKNGNWVRVGDPNQAIFETFTTASPEYLKSFLKEPGVKSYDLPNSGRSTASIIYLANSLIRWTITQDLVVDLQDALTTPTIEMTPKDDPQPNPEDNPEGIYIHTQALSPEQEIISVARSIEKWIPKHPMETCAVLVPRNERGAQLAEELKRRNIKYLELLSSSLSTRQTARKIASILHYLAEPASGSKLAAAYREIRSEEADQLENKELIHIVIDLLKRCGYVEEFLWPKPDFDWMVKLYNSDLSPLVINELIWLRDLMKRWQEATLLPVDQLILTIAHDLFENPADLALVHKLALVLERAAQNHPDWHLPEFTEELANISKNQQRFIGFTEEDVGFNPDNHPGVVVIATIHKAKGLEWDRVYLMSVNNYDFPSVQSYDSYIAEKYYVRDHLNLQAETLYQLEALLQKDPTGLYEEGSATFKARIDYSAERLRLLFVGITRARKDLAIFWNTGRHNDCVMALPLQALLKIWEDDKYAPSH